MKAKKQYLTVEDHLIMSEKLHNIMKDYMVVCRILEKEFNKNHPIMKRIYKIILTGCNKPHEELKNLLDEEWCKMVTDEELKQHGFVYYKPRD